MNVEERKRAARLAYVRREGIGKIGSGRASAPLATPKRRQTKVWLADQLRIKASALAGGRHHARTVAEQRLSLSRERDLLLAARNVLLGKPARVTEGRVVRDAPTPAQLR
jgi:hypothetical protein